MISRLKGILSENLGSSITVDVSGVGYEVFITPYVAASLGDIGSEITLTIYTDVRETAIILYGFSNHLEKQSFMLLKKVKGIGSKLALSILSALRPQELMVAIGTEDTSVLTSVSGVGKKSAERIIVELREMVREFVLDSKELTSLPRVSRTLSSQVQREFSDGALDAILALEKLGFASDRAASAVRDALKQDPVRVKDAGDLVRSALSYMT